MLVFTRNPLVARKYNTGGTSEGTTGFVFSCLSAAQRIDREMVALVSAVVAEREEVAPRRAKQ